jgi:hypothetical protein
MRCVPGRKRLSGTRSGHSSAHGLHSLDEPGAIHTTEQKLLFYADKRIKFAEVVSLDERFDDFALRYGKGSESERAKRWREQTRSMEKELFGKSVPTMKLEDLADGMAIEERNEEGTVSSSEIFPEGS